MLITALTPDHEIQKAIDMHFKASNAIEHAISMLYAIKLPNAHEAERGLKAQNDEVTKILMDLITERNMREARCRRAA